MISNTSHQRKGGVCYLLGLFFCLTVGTLNLAAETVDKFDVFFPQVAKGVLQGVRIECSLILSNPGLDPLDIQLRSYGLTLPDPSAFQLVARETREIELSGDALETGWVRITSVSPVTADLHLSFRSQDSGQVLDDLVFLPQPLTSRAVVPIFVSTPIADNTSLAFAFIQNGNYKFTLFDAQGRELRTKMEGTPQAPIPPHAAIYVTELFPDLPSDFRQGSLTIEHSQPADIALAFAATALYSRGIRVTTASVLGIDEPASYLVFLNSTQNVSEQADQLAAVYGFQVKRMAEEGWFEGLMTNEVARAVSRDARIKEVHPNAVGTFSSFWEQGDSHGIHLISGLRRTGQIPWLSPYFHYLKPGAVWLRQGRMRTTSLPSMAWPGCMGRT